MKCKQHKDMTLTEAVQILKHIERHSAALPDGAGGYEVYYSADAWNALQFAITCTEALPDLLQQRDRLKKQLQAMKGGEA